MLKEKVIEGEDLKQVQQVQLETKTKPSPVIFDREIRSYPDFVLRLVQFFIRISSRVVMKVLARVTVEGRENLKDLKGPLLIIANHKSYFDPLVIAYGIPLFSKWYPLRFIAKDQFFVNPFLRVLYLALGTYPAYYRQGLEKSLEIPVNILKQGGTIVFFPEGRCIREDQLGSPKIGVALLANKFPGITILPISIRSSYKILNGLNRPKIDINFGLPFKLGLVSLADSEKLAVDLFDKVQQLYSSK